MTPVFSALRALAAGHAPADNALLHNCWLEGFGTRAFGREPILDLFRRAPIDFLQTPDCVESPRNALIAQADSAIFADLHEGRFTRLWVLGLERLNAPELSVSVPRDLDLTQSEADLMFDPADHPDLDPAGAATLAGLKPPDLAMFSSRLFIVRAFSAGARVAALAVCAGASDATRRKPFSVNLAVLDSRSIIDQAGLAASRQAPWTPRLR